MHGKVPTMLATLVELQRLKNLDRTGWSLRGLPSGTESVAAHSFGVAVTAMLLADEVRAAGITLDMERVLRMSLVHDWAETRVGDMPKTATDYFGADARKFAEMKAFDDIVAGVGAGRSDYQGLYKDYEQGESLEARLVKAADVIDLLVQALALERAGARGLDEFWSVSESPNFGLPEAAERVAGNLLQSLLEARQALRSQGATS
nr:HD domain protein [uncultured bacterium]